MPITFTHPRNGERVTANLQPQVIVISPRYGESYSFDRAGRLLSLFVDGRSIQRTLDHRFLIRNKAGAVRRLELSPDERDALLKRLFATLHDLRAVLPELTLSPADQTCLADALDTVLAMPPEALEADAEAYRRLFLPVSILPPDQYLALVVQATIGCSWNRCTFCGLYRDRGFRVRGADEFRAHCRAVRDFFGAGLSLRRGVFLADANALTVPQPRLLTLLEIVQEVFGQPGQPPLPVFSFISAFDAQHKTVQDWMALRDRGLARVYIGLETGSDELLRFVRKPGRAADALAAVHDLKAAGLAVGVIAMVGLGGDRFAAQHVQETLAVIGAMPLDGRDVIYLSVYCSAPGTEYPTLAEQAGIRPLTPEEEAAQQQTLQTALRQRFPRTRVAPYYVEGFAL
ncbi:MAG: radical SAM protein [Anaerolineae bacterium]|nr:radical SAM protein [Anaerolineae bacterium]